MPRSLQDVGYDDLPEEAAAVVQEDEPPVDFGKKKGKKKKAAFDPDVASLASAALGEAQDPEAGLSESAVANGSAHAEQPANEPAAPEGELSPSIVISYSQLASMFLCNASLPWYNFCSFIACRGLMGESVGMKGSEDLLPRTFGSTL